MSKTKIAIQDLARRYRFVWPYVIPVASSDGRPIKPPYIPKKMNTGYPVISYRQRKLGITMKVQIHQIVMYQLHGDKIFEPGIVCRHINNDKNDFRSNNLALGTALDNYNDNSEETKLFITRTAKAAAKQQRILDLDDIHLAKELKAQGKTYCDIANELGVARNTIRYALLGLTYQDIIL